MKVLNITEQLINLLFLIFFVSCYVSPNPVYKLNPVSENTFWLFGQEYTKATKENIEIAFAFERIIDGNLIFDIEITNISDQTILISPEKIYYYPIHGIDDSSSNQNNKIFAIDPETKLDEVDSKISQETARYKSSTETDNAISLLDLMSDISTFGKKKTAEEIEKENKEDSDLEDSKYVRDENYRNKIYDLNILRDEWELRTIRKTTLLPNTFMQGRIYFPLKTNTKYINIYIPLKDDLINFVFLVGKHSSETVLINIMDITNPSTTIEFTLPESEHTTLKVYNILGKEVTELVSSNLPVGEHQYQFDGTGLASGIYYYQIVAGEYREVKKMILLR